MEILHFGEKPILLQKRDQNKNSPVKLGNKNNQKEAGKTSSCGLLGDDKGNLSFMPRNQSEALGCWETVLSDNP